MAIPGLTGNVQPFTTTPLASPYATTQNTGLSLGGGNYLGFGGQTQQTPPQNAQLDALASGQVYAPALDLTGIYKQSIAGANTAVNPYYTSKLQQFQAQQAAEKAIQQQQTQTNIENLQNQLQNTLQGNQISGQRTAQDVLQNEQQAGIKFDQQQQDQGTQFDQARIAQAKDLATSGLTTSGIGQGQQLASQTQRNTQESRQAADLAQQQQQQELFKTRTFEDLARSGELATKAEKTGEAQANFDLNNFIAQQQRTATSTTQDLEKARLADVAAETKRQGQLAIQKFINGLTNPAQIVAAQQKYGNYFA